MNREVFKNSMERLKLVYGEQYYPPQRIAILWNEYKNVSDEGFSNLIHELIGSYRRPPMIQEFRAKASDLIERKRERERSRQAMEAEEFWSGRQYPKEEEKQIIDTIRKRMNSEVTDHEWNDFMRMLCDNAGYTAEERAAVMGAA